MERRNFLKVAALASAVTSLNLFHTWGMNAMADTGANDMIYRPLGKTGVQVSIISIGGADLGRARDEAEAVRIVRSALDRGG